MADELDENTIRLLVATDSHVGYNEKDKVRGSDALNTFEEVLQISRTHHAELLLHGGDLFHDNKPSRGSLYKVMELLRRYCLGPGDVRFEVVSDTATFARGMVNYEDPNLNVEIPVFMIHGNHDDPGGDSNLCAANLLEMAGLLNYFGRTQHLEDIVIRPVLIRKGVTQLAIYGLGNIRDERLHRAFQAKKVRWETPAKPDEWVNIMILHQNRPKGNFGGAPTKSCIHEQFLPGFLDLVIWGHEHDCEITPKESVRSEFFVIQPGSSVATALTPGETAVKHVALIDVRAGHFRCTPVPLWTVRPLMLRDLVLSEHGLAKTDTQAVWHTLSSEVESMIAEGQDEILRRRRELEGRAIGSMPKLEVPSLPLIRLRVEHSGYETISVQTFGQALVDKVANPEEVLLFHRRGGGGAVGSRKAGPVSNALEIEENPIPNEDGVKIQDIIYRHLAGEKNLQILPEPDLNDAVQAFVHRSEQAAIQSFVQGVVNETNQAVLTVSRAVGEDEIRAQIEECAEKSRQQRLAHAAAGGDALPAPPGGAAGGALGSQAKPEPTDDPPPARGAAVVDIDLDFEAPSQRGRGRGGRTSARGRGGGSRAKRSQEELEMPPSQPAKQPRSATARAVQSTGSSSRAGLPNGGASLANGSGTRLSAPPVDTVPPPALPPAAATPFLKKRGGQGAEQGFADLADGAFEGSQRQSQAAPKRQWVLRTPG